MKRDIPVHQGSGNVFEDLGLSDAQGLTIQAELVRLLCLRIESLGLTQIEAAERLGLKQPDVSKLMRGKYTGFSAERLFRLLNALDQDIQIVVRPRPARSRREAPVSVVAA